MIMLDTYKYNNLNYFWSGVCAPASSQIQLGFQIKIFG